MKFFKKNSKLLAFVAAIVLVGGFFVNSIFAASAGSWYVSAPSSIQSGSSGTVTVGLNPGSAINEVTLTFTYDPSQLSCGAPNFGGSPFTQAPSAAVTGSGTISVDRALTGGSVGVTAQSKVFTTSCKAKVSGVSASVGVTGHAYYGTSVTPAAASKSISLTAAPHCTQECGGCNPTKCPPRCTACDCPGKSKCPPPPPPPPCTACNCPGKSKCPPAPKKKVVTAGVVAVTAEATDVQYTSATFSLNADKAFQAYIEYGPDGSFNGQTSTVSGSQVSIKDGLLVPGTTYSFRSVSVNGGKKTEGDTSSFTTKGLDISVTVLDKNKKPVANQDITFHSDPVTVKSDDKGVASFTGVQPGTHTVVYNQDGKDYVQTIEVTNNVSGSGSSQTAPVQNFDLTYSDLVVKGGGSSMWIIIVIVVVALVVAVLILKKIMSGRSTGGMLGGGGGKGGLKFEEPTSSTGAGDGIQIVANPDPGTVVAPQDNSGPGV